MRTHLTPVRNSTTSAPWFASIGATTLATRHEFRDPDEFMEFLKEEKPIRLPLYLYDHSGITISTESERFRACDPQGWDWGMLGYIYVTKENVRKEYGVKRVSRKILDKVTKLLAG